VKSVLGAAVLCLAAWPQIAPADTAADLQKIANAFNAQKAVHADEHFSNGEMVAVDSIPPDRIKVMPSKGGGEIVIGNQMWVNSNGKWTKMPSIMATVILKVINQYRNMAPTRDVDAASVKDLGMQSVGGKALHAYSYTAHGVPETIWVDATYLPMQAVVQSKNLTTTIVYSYDNVTIEAP
jgi:hypothetical protein